MQFSLDFLHQGPPFIIKCDVVKFKLQALRFKEIFQIEYENVKEVIFSEMMLETPDVKM